MGCVNSDIFTVYYWLINNTQESLDISRIIIRYIYNSLNNKIKLNIIAIKESGFLLHGHAGIVPHLFAGYWCRILVVLICNVIFSELWGVNIDIWALLLVKYGSC